MKTIKALVINPGMSANEIEIGSSLKSLQEIVGGYIEVVYPFDDSVAVICNEEGKIMGLEMNRPIHDEDGVIYDMICGTMIVVGDDEDSGEFVSLTDKQVEYYTKYYNNICYQDSETISKYLKDTEGGFVEFKIKL